VLVDIECRTSPRDSTDFYHFSFQKLYNFFMTIFTFCWRHVICRGLLRFGGVIFFIRQAYEILLSSPKSIRIFRSTIFLYLLFDILYKFRSMLFSMTNNFLYMNQTTSRFLNMVESFLYCNSCLITRFVGYFN